MTKENTRAHFRADLHEGRQRFVVSRRSRGAHDGRERKENMNDFNGAFAKVSPTETQNTIARIRNREAAHAAHSPFGADEPLEKRVGHQFAENDRVVVHSPGHYHHGAHGKITDARSDVRLQVKTDDGHELTASHTDLIPEALAPEPTSAKIAKHNAVQIEDEPLAKRARGGDDFKVGDTIVDKASGRKGTLTRLDVTHAEIDFGGGVTGICLRGYFEAAA